MFTSPWAGLSVTLWPRFAGDWSQLGPASAELVAYVRPKELQGSAASEH
jgi:hypothetical protein